MNAAHVHLMINHVPVIGTVFGLVLLAFGQWRKSNDLTKAALAMLVVVAAASIVTYLTGDPAADLVKKLAGVSEAVLERHDDAAGVAMGGSVAVGAAALVGLVWFQGGRPVNKWFGAAVLVAAVAVFGLMAWTAYLGGQIRHTELQSVG